MARFHLCCDAHVHQRARTSSAESGLIECGASDGTYIKVSTYHKRNLYNKNFAEFGNGDYVAIVGTLIFNGELGEFTLRPVYEKYIESGIEGVRSQAIGHYAVVIKYEDKVVIFGDPNGVYEVYYTTERSFFVSNSLRLCSLMLQRRVLSKQNLLQRSLEISEINNSTIFTNVRRLGARECLVIDASRPTMGVKHASQPEPDWDYQDKPVERVASDYTEQVNSVFKEIAASTSSLGVQATGGLDSRSVLAGLLNNNSKPLVFYGVGNSPLTNTKDEDLEAAQTYASEFNLEFHKMNWGGEIPTDTCGWNTLFKKFGFRFTTYGATKNYFASMKSENIPELMMSGYAYGTVSNTYYWEMDQLMPIKLEDVVEKHFSQTQNITQNTYKRKSKYLDSLVHDCHSALSDHGYNLENKDRIQLNDFVTYIQLLNSRSQSSYVNLANEFCYHIAPFATFKLGRPMLDFSPKHRSGERVRIMVIKKLQRALLDIPIYSGRKQAMINKENKLVFVNPLDRLIGIFKENVPLSILKLAHPIYRRYIFDAKEISSYKELHRAYVHELHKSLLSRDFNFGNYNGDIRLLSRLALYVHGLNQIGYDQIES